MVSTLHQHHDIICHPLLVNYSRAWGYPLSGKHFCNWEALSVALYCCKTLESLGCITKVLLCKLHNHNKSTNVQLDCNCREQFGGSVLMLRFNIFISMHLFRILHDKLNLLIMLLLVSPKSTKPKIHSTNGSLLCTLVSIFQHSAPFPLPAQASTGCKNTEQIKFQNTDMSIDSNQSCKLLSLRVPVIYFIYHIYNLNTLSISRCQRCLSGLVPRSAETPLVKGTVIFMWKIFVG